jgi:hypothetical protein
VAVAFRRGAAGALPPSPASGCFAVRRQTAITAPTAALSFRDLDFAQHAGIGRFQLDVGLVGLDLRQRFALATWSPGALSSG